MEQRELRDSYDISKNKTGLTYYKGEILPDGHYYLVVIIIIQNNKGEFLIQKRSVRKDGTWALTGGHPKSGESSLEGILTEVKEEIGLDLSQNPILVETYNDENTIVDIYYIKEEANIDNLVLQVEEVEQVRWASLEEIEAMNSKKIFHETHYEIFHKCLNIINL